MSKLLFKPDAASLVLRLGLGAIFVFHGFLKLAYGASQWSPDLNPQIQVAVAYGETIAGIAFLAGFLTRVAALGIIAIMIGAITSVTGKLDFVPMENSAAWNGVNVTGTGYEYNVAIIVMCVALILLGSGVVSLDHILFGRRKAPVGQSVPPAPGVPPQVPSGV
jgi:putative oxidoreductase